MEGKILSEALLRSIDTAVDEAVEEVRESGPSVKATVTVTFTVAEDKESGLPVVEWTLKHGIAQRGEIMPPVPGQMRFALPKAGA